MFCEGCVLEIANAVIRRDPSDNEAPEPRGGGISSRILSSIRSREGMGNTLVSRKKKKKNQLRFTPYYYTFKTLGLAAQAPLLSRALADVCGRPLQFVSSDYGAANEISVPAAPRPAGVELPHATKSHGLPFSPAAGQARQPEAGGRAAMAWWCLSSRWPRCATRATKWSGIF